MATKTMDVLDLKRVNAVKPDGVYRLRIEAAEVKQGNKGLLLNLRLRFVGDQGSIFQSVPLTGDGSFMYDQFLDAIGAAVTGKMKVSELRSQTFYAKVYTNVYNGQESNKVRQFLKPEAGEALLDVEKTIRGAGERLRATPGLEADTDFGMGQTEKDKVDDDGFPI